MTSPPVAPSAVSACEYFSTPRSAFSFWMPPPMLESTACLLADDKVPAVPAACKIGITTLPMALKASSTRSCEKPAEVAACTSTLSSLPAASPRFAASSVASELLATSTDSLKDLL